MVCEKAKFNLISEKLCRAHNTSLATLCSLIALPVELKKQKFMIKKTASGMYI